MFIYILKLTENKYYIGKSTNIINRIEDHILGNGAEYTKIFKPIKLLKTIETNDKFDEDKITMQYMELYGICNVRGGTFSKPILPEYQIETLLDMLHMANDKCLLCGLGNHFAKNCTTYDNIEEYFECKYCNKNFTFDDLIDIHKRECKNKKVLKQTVRCYKCGLAGHYANTCYR